MDEKDNRTKYYMKDPNYDVVQYYIIMFSHDNFQNGITFFRLYFFLLKVKFFYKKRIYIHWSLSSIFIVLIMEGLYVLWISSLRFICHFSFSFFHFITPIIRNLLIWLQIEQLKIEIKEQLI